jgi:multidrug resistance efflux pump
VSVKVVRERSDQRRHHRVTAPLFVEFDGHRIKATDWSLGGLRIDDFPGALPGLGATINLYLSIPFQGFDVRFDCDAEVVRRIEASKTFAVKYSRIGERELGLMEHFIDELIRGSMVDVKETIQRIDVPVTPASTKPDVNPLSKIPISRWPTRTIAFAAMYLTIGLFVFGYAGVIAYTNFVRMEVDSAVIASPIEAVRAQVNGRIIHGKYRQGDHVPKGALLLGVVDNELERQIDLATIDIKDKAAQLSAQERLLVEEMSRIDAFAKVEGKNVEQIGLEVQSLEAQAKAAQALHGRLNHLYKQGFTTATLVENAEKQMISAQKLAQAKRVELQTRQSLAAYNAGERLYNGQTFYGDRAKTEAQTFLAREHVAIAEKKLQALLDHRDRLAIYAPYAGVLQELPRPDNSMVRTGDTLAVIENPKAREIWAFLRQDEVLSVGLGDEVKIYLPGLSELRKARVVRIDRTIGFVNEMNSTYIWRAPRDRSAKVILEFSDTGAKPQDESYRTGMPAVAIFSTRPTNYLVGDMMHRFKMVFGGRPRKPAEGASTTTAGTRTRDPDAPAAPTPGTSNRDRLGPPRNYERADNPVRDPDAVAARS